MQFTLAVFEIFLCKSRSVQRLIQQITRSKRFKFSVKNKKSSVFVKVTRKVIVVLNIPKLFLTLNINV